MKAQEGRAQHELEEQKKKLTKLSVEMTEAKHDLVTYSSFY